MQLNGSSETIEFHIVLQIFYEELGYTVDESISFINYLLLSRSDKIGCYVGDATLLTRCVT